MRRGFKSEAERLADRTRDQMDLQPHAPLPIRRLAQHLHVEVYAADRLVDREMLVELDEEQPGAFSAATFHLPGGRTAVVYNPFSDEGRTNSDLAHEFAHILLSHEVRELQQIGGHTFFTCDPEQEAEANWLAGCLLLPRTLLLKEAYSGADAAAIATRHQVSLPMARFRLNTSGVLLQVRRGGGARTARSPLNDEPT